MTKFVLFSVGAVTALLALDYYVYRNWRWFVRHRRGGSVSLRWTLPLYRVFLAVMPVTLPLYFIIWHWWEVEPKLLRAAFLGFWAVYYVPKVVIALVLLVKDGLRFVIWLFGWFQQRLLAPAEETGDGATHRPERTASLDLSDMKRHTRREFLRELGWGAASVPFVVVGYSVFRTLYDFEVCRVEVPIAGLPRAFDGLTIGQLSDLHAGSFFSARPMEEAVHLVNGHRPDLVVITGDYVNHDAKELELIAPALSRLRAELGVYGCLGNHDHYAAVDRVTRGVRTTPVDLLVNEHRTLEVDGARLHVVGTDNTGFNQYFGDLPRAVSGIEPHPHGEEARVLLAHDPTFWDAEVRPTHPEVDLMLAGHTHGGQVGVDLGPLRWSVARVVYDRWAGLYTEDRPSGTDRHHLYVNRGIGTVGPPMRLGIRPEVTLLTLRRT